MNEFNELSNKIKNIIADIILLKKSINKIWKFLDDKKLKEFTNTELGLFIEMDNKCINVNEISSFCIQNEELLVFLKGSTTCCTVKKDIQKRYETLKEIINRRNL